MKMPLQLKMTIIVILVVLLTAGAGMTIASEFITALIYENYEDIGFEAIGVAKTQLDADKLETYFERFKAGEEQDESYDKFERFIIDVISTNPELHYLYVIMPKEDAVYYIFDADEEAYKENLIFDQISYDDPATPDRDVLLNGEELWPMETDSDSFGHYYTVWSPVADSTGKVIAYMGADIEMSEMTNTIKLIRQLFVIMTLVATVFVAIVAVLIISHIIVKPITLLSNAANELTGLMESSQEKEKFADSNNEIFSKLKIKNKDEIGGLHKSLITMEEASHNYYSQMMAATAEKERIGTELDLAKNIQTGMLPAIFPRFANQVEYDLYATMRTAKEVGGDFYDFFYIDDDHLALVIADVSGKGVPGALFMMISKIIIKNRAQAGGTPAKILEDVNNQLCDNNPNQMFVTVWLGILDIKTGEVKAANGGHECPYIAGPDGKYEIFDDPHGLVLGALEDYVYEDYEFTIPKGGYLFAFTDGVPEAQDKDSELFGATRTEEVLNSDAADTPEHTVNEMLNAIDTFVGEADQFDDITMFCLHFRGTI